ncbi:MAG: tRNA (adenosine(37)-N6)-dimethylallyltransferase MiaA [Nitrospiraceae bacterium]|nr:tRNA (adenosine(37)-N6)-dimethylallyltransferase MiaA [Nitrospiraceae bacterium]
MKRVIILLGPTGVGKTGASILLAKELDTEIISADSMQIYRGMDIGTAKPSAGERSGVVHHMIDIVNPSRSFSTGQFIEAITGMIDDLHARGKVPLIVGGTGLYIKAITRGIFSGPSADWALREELIEKERAEKGALYLYLSEIDPDAAARIDPHDTRRIIRAVEVCLKSGDRISALQERLTSPLPYDFLKIGLTRERSELYGMIERRVDDMIEAGLVEEVERLLRQSPDRTPLQAIGYKEVAAYLRGEISLAETVLLIKRNTRRYAKRQFTWFGKEEGIRWVDVTGIFESAGVFARIKELLE